MTYLKQIKELESKIKSLNDQIDSVSSEWIKAECPVKVGDRVKVNQYSYCGKEMRIEKIEVYRSAVNKPLLYPQDKNIIAIATSEPLSLQRPIEQMKLDNPE